MSINTILVICVGNVCRSPMAEALLASALPTTTVVSAGTHALVGERAAPLAHELMARRGFNISAHRAQQVSAILCRKAEIILVMNPAQRRYLNGVYPSVTGKVFRIAEKLNADVPDPYQQPRQVFEDALEIIESGLNVWIERFKKANFN